MAIDDTQLAIERERNEQTALIQVRQMRMESIRMAKDIITENRRNAPVGEREITYEEIVKFAMALEDHVTRN